MKKLLYCLGAVAFVAHASAQNPALLEPVIVPALGPAKPKPVAAKISGVVPTNLVHPSSARPISEDFIQSLARLKNEHEALLRDRAEVLQEVRSINPVNNDNVQIKAQIEELIARIAVAPYGVSPPHKSSAGSPKLDRIPTDPIGLARVLYASKDYDGVLRTLRMTDMEMMDKQDRAFARYLIGSCLRMEGKRSEAAAMYREVADAKEDEFISECAVWQVQAMKFQQDTQSQLEDSAKRRESK